MSKSKQEMRVIERPILYRPVERYWYRITDYVQPRWRRFADSRTGYAVGVMLAILLRVLRFIGGAIVIVGGMVLYMLLSFAMGGGKKRRR